jgi:enoyl-CoA hydratase/carnithine racemase
MLLLTGEDSVSTFADEIRLDRDGQIAVITLSHPQARNALTWNMYDRLLACCEEVDADVEVRVVVLRGAGEAAFAAGTDITQFPAFRQPEDVIVYEQRIERVVDRLERVRHPTIAMLRGYCVGGGLAIAAACDFRYAAPDLRLGVPIARTLGNCLSMSNYARIVDLVGPACAKELIMQARLLTAEQALALGLVTEVVPADRLECRVQEAAADMAGLAPLTLRATKEAIRRIQARRRIDPREGEDLIVACYMSRDFREAVQAFLGKGPHRWTGV